MIGIIVAMNEELEAIKKYMINIQIEERFENEFFIGDIGKSKCILTVCGIGKVNAARTTQILIDNYNPEYVINIGVAGGISNRVNIGDIVIGEKLVQYDFDLTAFGREKGEVSDKIGKFIYSNSDLLKKARNAFESNKFNFKIVDGIIASGDKFVTEIDLSKNINEDFNADCVEMEGASIAQVCFLDNVPFIVFRSISDSPNEKNELDFERFLEMSSKNVAEFVCEYINIYYMK